MSDDRFDRARLDELAGRDRERLAQLNKELLREIGFVRDTFRQLDALALGGIEAGERLADLHPVALSHEHRLHRAGDAGHQVEPQPGLHRAGQVQRLGKVARLFGKAQVRGDDGEVCYVLCREIATEERKDRQFVAIDAEKALDLSGV